MANPETMFGNDRPFGVVAFKGFAMFFNALAKSSACFSHIFCPTDTRDGVDHAFLIILGLSVFGIAQGLTDGVHSSNIYLYSS